MSLILRHSQTPVNPDKFFSGGEVSLFLREDPWEAIVVVGIIIRGGPVVG
ncbi:unnamed protein product [marine sediment metagenome]|uniref:Uncharacterized protein n=1 Tax=marine sediment metagenome TaxID=412755 RepID=X1IEN3_9ZZZZ